MDYDFEKLSADMLELSSEQRLHILFELNEKNTNIASMAKILDATAPEVHRNFNRMVKANLIQKNVDGTYSLSNYGKFVHTQVINIKFAQDNKKFFETHDFGDMPVKFIRRLGELSVRKHIKGFVKTLEIWKSIHENAERYIYNVLHEIPYSDDVIDTVSSKLNSGISIKSVIAENAVISENRNKIFKEKNFQQFLEQGLLERRMMRNISVVVLLNEKEAAIIFPNTDKPDMSEMFHSTDPQFHEWCYDFFMHCWNCSSSFREEKLSQ